MQVNNVKISSEWKSNKKRVGRPLMILGRPDQEIFLVKDNPPAHSFIYFVATGDL